MKKTAKTNWLNMNEISGFLLYSAYFAWKRKIESTLLPHDLTHVQFMLLMSLGFLKQDGDERSKFSKLMDAGISKIQAASKDFLKAEESFFTILGEKKQDFDEYLRGILQVPWVSK